MDKTGKWRAHCITHDWEGMERETLEEAEEDRIAHIELFPNEEHVTGIADESAAKASMQHFEVTGGTARGLAGGFTIINNANRRRTDKRIEGGSNEYACASVMFWAAIGVGLPARKNPNSKEVFIGGDFNAFGIGFWYRQL